jgi:hypothetical protein
MILEISPKYYADEKYPFNKVLVSIQPTYFDPPDKYKNSKK